MSSDIERLQDLIDQYWNIAWLEGDQGRRHDTKEGDAQECRSEIEEILSRIARAQGGEWVRCDERLPTEADGNLIWSHDQKRGSVELCSWAWSHSLFKHGYITHWQPTGLTRPQPPKSKEGES